MFAELYLTDTANSFILDLLSCNRDGWGFGLDRYTPGRMNLKGGGVWQDSPIASGRRLVDGVRGNVNDALELKIAYPSHNEVIQAQQALDSIIEMVYDYWMTNEIAGPVYLVARAPGESRRRYAIVYDLATDEYPDPYHEPFAGYGKPAFVAEGMRLGIERSAWLNTIPQTGTAVDSTHNLHGTTGQLSVPIGNRYGSNLATMHRYNGSVFDVVSLITYSAPYTIFYPTGTPAAGWITYWGSNKPFGSLIFDIGTAMSATSYTVVWEYYNGSAWTALTAVDSDLHTYSVNDGTNQFANTGVRIVRWSQPYNWVITTVNSVGYYWIRARISALTGTPVNPTQQNRHVYADGRPYVEIASTEVTGDLDALAKIACLLQAAPDLNTYRCNQVFAGLRKTSRGANFVAYINVLTADNPSGVTITPTTDTSIHASAPQEIFDARSSTRWMIESVMVDTESIGEIFRVTFANTIVDHYRGRFRLLARTLGTGAQLRYTIKVGATLAGISKTGEKRTLAGESLGATSAVKFQVVDLGEIEIPPTSLLRPDEAFGSLDIIIEGVVPEGAGTKTIYINDLILLPIDEWSAEANANYLVAADVERTIEIDSIGNPKQNIRSVIRDTSPAVASIGCRTVANQEAVLHANATQRLWFVMSEFNSNTGASKSNLELNAIVSLQAQQRYFHLRAD